MIQRINDQISVFRDDVYPSLGGGNKARKMMALDAKIKELGHNALVTTGGVQSNHCRAVALYSKKNKLECTLVLHGDKNRILSESGNAKIMRESGATLVFCDSSEISDHMDAAMQQYIKKGLNPLYIYGGGHTLEAGHCYITELEKLLENNYKPDYIFLASGSGTTQSGLLAGVSKKNVDIKIVGISVGRASERAQNIVGKFYNELCDEYYIEKNEISIVVDDSFLSGGYEKYNADIKEIADDSLMNYGFALDTTYTAKAFYGMLKTIEQKKITGQVLFWYTGGIYNYLAK
ncbi:1-aminocyclopropane-1-carboxylate deaminase/D-cysteine desulfhydrase [Flagellimonas halotolerans]|uniref:Pyridoxal-phosphate dependent enzyme n=1 Tax=Flagellimonas halotolerans TaxID=3112164 RepID=A0ABU6ISA0_9FLAO|nr:pyridoxal-phosphate dependent enzyme [Muricauda sp. SYSU M86414]MEC4266010.1 pyridoxal-phosphate dependent enzyme [Muricauda sp. SYSU M84420]